MERIDDRTEADFKAGTHTYLVVGTDLTEQGVPMHYVQNTLRFREAWLKATAWQLAATETGVARIAQARSKFVEHVLELPGEDASAWLECNPAQLTEILTDRVSKLHAAYAADMQTLRDNIDSWGGEHV